MSQCILVKAGQRCANDSQTFPYGLSVPVVKPDAMAWICGDCIYDMYQVMTAGDFPSNALKPDQIKR